MVRQDFDTKRLRSLRAELEQQTSLLPAVLQTSNCVALVDHLTSIFKHEDWVSPAKCSQWSPDPEAAEPSGWNAFQDLLRQDTQSDEAQTELQAMDMAQTELHANICSIQQTTCLPQSRLGALASTLGTDNAGSLNLVRCTVCHSLLLTTAFDDHLPRCRPCDPQSARPSRSSTPQPRQGSKAGLNAKGAKGSKKGKGRGSSKPPAGPSRFAIEQAKTASHQNAFANTIHSQPGLQTPQYPVQYPPPEPPLQHCDSAPRISLQANQAWPTSTVQQPALPDRHQGNGTFSTSAEGLIPARQPQGVKRPRNAWTYIPGLSRSNPDVDAVHDPCLPPRFPQSVTRSRRKRDSSMEPEAQAYHDSNAQHAKQQEPVASRTNVGKTVSALSGSKHLQQGLTPSSANLSAPPAKRSKQAVSAQDDFAGGPHDLWQHQLPESAEQLHSSQSNGAGLQRHAHQSGHFGQGSQNGQHTHSQCTSHRDAMDSSAAHPQMQRQDSKQLPSGQSAWSHLPSSHNQAQLGNGYRLQQPPSPSHRLRQPVSGQTAAQTSLPYANGAAMTHPGHSHQQSSPGPSMWSPMNGYRAMHSNEGGPAHRPRSGGWHMPESKRQVSVNALARSSYGA